MLDIETRSLSSVESLEAPTDIEELLDADLHAEDIPADKDAEYFEFKLARSAQLRCPRGGAELGLAACGSCESCRLLEETRDARQWFWRCGQSTQRRFVAGLLQRFHSADLLRYVVHLTAPHDSCKDRTYARSRSRPGMLTDRSSRSALAVPDGSPSADRALDPSLVQQRMLVAWAWFADATYWTKVNYILALMRLCDSEQLALLSRQAQTMLAIETRVAAHKETLTLSRASSAVTARTRSVLSSGSRSENAKDMDSPELMVLPNASKAYSGIARHKDFIKELPVHLSKFILGMLDEATLFSCQNVSLSWHQLVAETKKEFFTNQQMQEDIMLMQGSSGVNPAYANDLSVLVPNVCGKNGDVVLTDEAVVEARFKSEINMASAYSGISTRRVMMEERNVYCGSYNVLVLVTEPYKQRTMHTCGGKYVAVDSTDRRIHLVDIATASESMPPIAGHSGPIRAIHVNESEGFVLSGSFDTSVRKWDLQSRRCTRIFNGHQDTIVALDYSGKFKQFASASLDCSAKVWDVDTGKCVRTFKHKHPVICVALSDELCISGCQAGRVKVWDLETGKLVKMLSSHKADITAIKFDKWHIITASKDGYALAWSSQGKHDRCVMALRHPCEVTSVEFMYLRVITGAQDGRVRIWNLITGQCCRIMRGNSQSDPIISLTAVGDSLTVNTRTNVLVLSFETVVWDYSLSTDKTRSLVPSNVFANAPLKAHSYAYVRAHRSEQANCADRRLIEKSAVSRTRVGSAVSRRSSRARSAALAASRPFRETDSDTSEGVATPAFRDADDAAASAQRPQTTSVVTKVVSPLSSATSKRRVSWAFQSPDSMSYGDTPLEEVKTMLKKQIRGDMSTSDHFCHFPVRTRKDGEETDVKAHPGKESRLGEGKTFFTRPHSSPSKLDSRTKIKVTKTQWTEALGDALPSGFASGECVAQAGSPTTPAPSERPRTSHSLGYDGNRAIEAPPELGMRVVRRSPGSVERSSSRPLSTTATELSEVPMLMYPKKQPATDGGVAKHNYSSLSRRAPSATAVCAVPAAYSLCSSTSLRLRTYTQEHAMAGVGHH